MSVGVPQSPGDFFSVFEIKKKNFKKTHKKPNPEIPEAVGVFYWGLGKGMKRRKTSIREEAGVGP